jgi:hypothetical protein
MDILSAPYDQTGCIIMVFSKLRDDATRQGIDRHPSVFFYFRQIVPLADAIGA